MTTPVLDRPKRLRGPDGRFLPKDGFATAPPAPGPKPRAARKPSTRRRKLEPFRKLSTSWAELSEDDLAYLRVSPEVAWYCQDRGIPVPTCPPQHKTPEPRDSAGAVFDPKRVDRLLKSFRQLAHVKGRFAGKPLNPDPWQTVYILAPTFGWVRWDDDAEDYVRIITTLYVDLPRKNGKTTLASGIGIYLTAADREPGAQVLACATTKDQARFAFDPIRQLAESSPNIKPYLKALKGRITHPRSGSYFQPVANVGDAQHGADLHGAIVDELHLHKTTELIEAIETGTGSRTQPLIVFITTADSGKRNTPYDAKRTRIEQLERGALKDPSTYGVVWGVSEKDDPFSEETWKKANPGYGVSPTRRYLRERAEKAKDSPVELASFQRLHLGIRTKQVSRYIRMDVWDRNASMVDELSLAGRRAFGGLDLGNVSDITAWCLLFPDEDKTSHYSALWRLWIPENKVADLDARTADNASAWVKAGLIKTTPGDTTDYEFIEAQIKRDLERFDVTEVAYDPWNSSQTVTNLTNAGAPMVEVRQGFASLSPPLKELQKILLQGSPEDPRLRHGGNPAVRWMMDNLAVVEDPSGNVKPDKGNAADKIDAIAALVNALARAMVDAGEDTSAYDDGHELLIV